MIFKPILSALTGLAIASPSIAADIAPTISSDLTTIGKWKMEVREKRPDGQSLCIEHWTFGSGDKMHVVSGKQHIEKSWRIASDAEFDKMFMTTLFATADPDCMGEVSQPVNSPQKESGGFALQKLGNAYILCTPMVVEDVKRKTRTTLWGENCWATLSPVEIR